MEKKDRLKVEELFREKGNLDYTEIVSMLDLDLELVVNICEELVKAGKIEEI